MNVRKMYVIPSDFYDSLMKKSKIIEDPLITAQIRIQDQKDKILKKSKDSDARLRSLEDISQKQAVLEEQRKKQTSEPIPVSIIPDSVEIKKRGRPPKKPKESYFEFDEHVGHGLADMFYDFEPKGKTTQDIMKNVRAKI